MTVTELAKAIYSRVPGIGWEDRDVRNIASELRANGVTDALLAVAAERVRQVSVEGWTPEHDDRHVEYEMAAAAGTYARYAGLSRNDRGLARGLTPVKWPWDSSWWKPTTRRRDLEKAGALIIAEMERLERAEAREAER